MSVLRPGNQLPIAATTALGLEGRWAVWSGAADCAGAYFLSPSDSEARATGLKYAVIKASMGRSAVEPRLELLRTDPHKPGLIKPKKGSRR